MLASIAGRSCMQSLPVAMAEFGPNVVQRGGERPVRIAAVPVPARSRGCGIRRLLAVGGPQEPRKSRVRLGETVRNAYSVSAVGTM